MSVKIVLRLERGWVADQPRSRGFVQVIACLAVAALLVGCSSFNREWNRLAKSNASLPGITGLWEGNWQSGANDHSGQLRCIVTQQDTNRYSAKFKARYQVVLSFSYTVDLEAEQTGELWRISGREDLGSLAGGIYQYDGQVSATNLFATYRSRYDHGTFQMRRPDTVATAR
jgi:hypothetical protein